MAATPTYGALADVTDENLFERAAASASAAGSTSRVRGIESFRFDRHVSNCVRLCGVRMRHGGGCGV